MDDIIIQLLLLGMIVSVVVIVAIFLDKNNTTDDYDAIISKEGYICKVGIPEYSKDIITLLSTYDKINAVSKDNDSSVEFDRLSAEITRLTDELAMKDAHLRTNCPESMKPIRTLAEVMKTIPVIEK